MIIRDYTEQDAQQAGCLISETYAEFNLNFAAPELKRQMLGPFQFAGSSEAAHQIAIVNILTSPIFYVAEVNQEIVGILRGRKERLASLFVRKEFHHQGIGRQLVTKFEAEMIANKVKVIRVAATVYAVPFYEKLGYKKSTGLRRSWSFDGYGFPVQPMRKVL